MSVEQLKEKLIILKDEIESLLTSIDDTEVKQDDDWLRGLRFTDSQITSTIQQDNKPFVINTLKQPDTEVPDFEQDFWYPVKDVTTDFVRRDKYLADFKSDMQKHDEVMERMLTHPRKEPPYTMAGVQPLINKTGQDTCYDFEPDPDSIPATICKNCGDEKWRHFVISNDISRMTITNKNPVDIINNVLVNKCNVEIELVQAYSRLIVQSLKKEGLIC